MGYTCTENDDPEKGEALGIYTSESGVTVIEAPEWSV